MWYSLLPLGYKPVQHVTVLNTVGNCNTTVLYYNIIIVRNHRRIWDPSLNETSLCGAYLSFQIIHPRPRPSVTLYNKHYVEHLLIPRLPAWRAFYYGLSAIAHSTQAWLHPLKTMSSTRHFPMTFCIEYTVLVGKPEGRRPPGIPRRRWVDNIRMDLQEVGCGYMDWIGLAQDRDRWRTLVSAVMNLGVPWNTGNFLTSSKTVSFSRRTLHHGVSK